MKMKQKFFRIIGILLITIQCSISLEAYNSNKQNQQNQEGFFDYILNQNEDIQKGIKYQFQNNNNTNSTGEGIFQIADNKIDKNEQCDVQECYQCQEDRADRCIQCQPNFYILRAKDEQSANSCVKDCGQGFYKFEMEDGKKVCRKCSHLCYECQDNFENCQSCKEGFLKLSDTDKCVSKCGEGYFEQGIYCENCIKNCDKCKNKKECEKCEKDYEYDSEDKECRYIVEHDKTWWYIVSGIFAVFLLWFIIFVIKRYRKKQRLRRQVEQGLIDPSELNSSDDEYEDDSDDEDEEYN